MTNNKYNTQTKTDAYSPGGYSAGINVQAAPVDGSNKTNPRSRSIPRFLAL